MKAMWFTTTIAAALIVILLTACSDSGSEATPTLPAATQTSGSADMPSETNTGGGNADVIFVRAEQRSDGTWNFTVTVQHPDTGWEDYADGWDVVLPDGAVIIPHAGDAFTRVLLQPHETEQPFTRSQSGIQIPDDAKTVTVRAHDLVDGWGGQEVMVDLTAADGEGFEVSRN